MCIRFIFVQTKIVSIFISITITIKFKWITLMKITIPCFFLSFRISIRQTCYFFIYCIQPRLFIKLSKNLDNLGTSAIV